MKRRPITRVLVAFMSLLLICTSVLSVPSTVEAATKPTKITLNATKKTLYVGEKFTLKVKSVKPAKASKAVKYTTSNKKVATVTAKGVVTAKKKGTATITVTSKSNKKATAKCKVTVKQQVKSITVTNAVNKTVVVRKGKTLKLKTSVAPTNADNKKVTYTVKDKKIATVDKNGKIKAKKVGKTTITIKAKDGKKASAKITVIVPKTVVKSVKLDKKTATIKVGSSVTLKATLNPKKPTVKTVTWKSSNEKVATVSSKGKVTGKTVGTAKITVTTLDGSKKATCKVTVAPILVTGITVKAAKTTLTEGDTTTVSATVAPTNATNKAVTWSTSNAKVATVDAKGNVKTLAAGTVTITATAQDGSKKSGTCQITVNKKPATTIAVSSVTLKDVSMKANETDVKLSATVAPANATNKAVTYTSENTKYLTVNTDGTLVPNATELAKAGKDKVEVKVTATAGGKTATATVTIVISEDAFDAETYTYTLYKNAVSYDVTRNTTTASVTPASVAADIENLAGRAWSNATLKNNWNDAGIQKVMGLLVAKELGASDRVATTVVDGKTMTVSAKGKTVTVTRTDNADGTSSLEFKTSTKTVNLQNITVKEDTTAYTINTTAQVGKTSKKLEIVIAKDASSVVVNQIVDSEKIEVMSVTSDTNAYQIKINKGVYLNLVEELGRNPIDGTTVVNCYVDTTK